MKRTLLIVSLLASLCPGQRIKPPLGQQLDYGNSLTKDLAVCWTFSDGAGARLNDVSHAMAYGTIIGSAWIASQYGNALNLPTTSGYVTFTAEPEVEMGTSDMTFVALVRTSSTDTTNYLIYKGASGDADEGYNWYMTNAGVVAFRISDGVAREVYTSSLIILNDGLWHMLGITLDRSSATGLTYWLDGVQKDSDDPTTYSASDITDLTEVFAISVNGTSAFNGDMAFLAIWKRCLSPIEMRQMSINPYDILVNQAIVIPPTGGAQIIMISGLMPIGVILLLSAMLSWVRRRAR